MDEPLSQEFGDTYSKIHGVINNHTGKSVWEKKFEALNRPAVLADTGYTSGLFGMMGYALKTLFGFAKYLFPLAFALKAFDWVTFILAYKTSANPNTEKKIGLGMKTLEAALLGIAVFGGTLFKVMILGSAVATGPVIFLVLLSVGAVYNLARAIFFGIKAALISNEAAKTDERLAAEKTFFQDEAIESLKGFVINLVTLVALTAALVFAPYVLPVVTKVATVIASVVLGVIAVKAAWNFYVADTAFGKKVQENVFNPIAEGVNRRLGIGIDKQAQINQTLKSDKESLIPSKNEKNSETNHATYSEKTAAKEIAYSNRYYGNLALKKIDLTSDAVNDELEKLNASIENAIYTLDAKAKSIGNGAIEQIFRGGEKAKLINKINALKSLKIFMHGSNAFMLHLENQEENNRNNKENVYSCEFGSSSFEFKSLEDFLIQLDENFITTYEGIYESNGQKIGATQNIFRHAYNILLTWDALHSQSKETVTPEKFIVPHPEKPPFKTQTSNYYIVQ